MTAAATAAMTVSRVSSALWTGWLGLADSLADSLAAGGTLLMISKEAGGQSQTGRK